MLPNRPSPLPGLQRYTANRAGQALIFIILALLILFFVVLWSFDLHKTLRVKMDSQNAGDAAALAAARWQGISLNLIGDLNIVRALALSAGDSATLDSVSNLQARLCIVGPMIAFMAAQQGAKNNRIHQNAEMTQLIQDHAQLVRSEYPAAIGQNGDPRYPEPYPGAWTEYADMLDLAAADGIAAGPENARYFSDFTGDHILLDPGFYDAVAGRSWCWFYHNAPDLLRDYTDYTWWPPLPEIVLGEYINSEFFGLGLARQGTSARRLVTTDTLAATAAARGIAGSLTPAGMATGSVWYCYGAPWTPWTALSPDAENPFPAVGPLRPKYDYAGADASVRTIANASRITPGPGGTTTTNKIVWTAAAKPFGYLDESDPPTAVPLVLPAFHDVRLIPMDTSSAADTGGFDPEWRRFIEEDLPQYLATGNINCNSYYCDQLRTFEDPKFRADGDAWLGQHSDQCTDSGGGGGGGGGGGSRVGH